MEHYELRLLYDWTIPPALLPHIANTWQNPAPRAGGGELEKDEVAEVVLCEIVPPVTGAGVSELLRRVVINLDDVECPYISISGIRDHLMCPPRRQNWAGKMWSFGTPGCNNPMLNTTLKYTDRVSISALAGAANITTAYQIRLWGFVYKHAELPSVFGTMQFPRGLVDRARGRVIPLLEKAPIVVSAETWKQLPGGKNQQVPKINPYGRFAFNFAVTDGLQGEYPFRFDTTQVLNATEELYWDFDEKDALLIKGVGMYAGIVGTTLGRTYLMVDGDIHPKGGLTTTPGWPTVPLNNPIHYGWAAPVWPVAIPLFYAIPLLDRPLMVHKEKAYVAVRDAGAVVGANAVVACVTGTRIEMSG